MISERTTEAAKSPFEGTVTRELIRAAKGVRSYFQQVLAADGEALSTFIVLDVVARAEGRRQRDIAEGVHIEGATMTRHLDRLETAGLVARRRDPSDRRAILVDLTPSGRAMHERLRSVVAMAHDRVWQGIAERDRETTRRVSRRLTENLERLTTEVADVG